MRGLVVDTGPEHLEQARAQDAFFRACAAKRQMQPPETR